VKKAGTKIKFISMAAKRKLIEVEGVVEDPDSVQGLHR